MGEPYSGRRRSEWREERAAGDAIAQGSLTSLTARPDLSWFHEAVGLGAVLDATVVGVDRLAELDIGGTVLLAPQAGLTDGDHVRVRIPAREERHGAADA